MKTATDGDIIRTAIAHVGEPAWVLRSSLRARGLRVTVERVERVLTDYRSGGRRANEPCAHDGHGACTVCGETLS